MSPEAWLLFPRAPGRGEVYRRSSPPDPGDPVVCLFTTEGSERYCRESCGCPRPSCCPPLAHPQTPVICVMERFWLSQLLSHAAPPSQSSEKFQHLCPHALACAPPVLAGPCVGAHSPSSPLHLPPPSGGGLFVGRVPTACAPGTPVPACSSCAVNAHTEQTFCLEPLSWTWWRGSGWKRQIDWLAFLFLPRVILHSGVLPFLMGFLSSLKSGTVTPGVPENPRVVSNKEREKFTRGLWRLGAPFASLPACYSYLHLNLEKGGKQINRKKVGLELGDCRAAVGPAPPPLCGCEAVSLQMVVFLLNMSLRHQRQGLFCPG